jgi:hypothetical protein
MFQKKSYRENQNTHFMCNNFSPENLAVYQITWKYIVQPGSTQMKIWLMRIACSISKATNTHSEYVIVVAFLLQQWLKESASMLLYTYIACLGHSSSDVAMTV